MAHLGQKINVADIPEGTDFTPVPAGDYTVMITDSEMKENKAGNGSYLKITMDIQDGKEQGRKLFDMLNLNHPNETATQIAWQKLGEISRAVGLETIEDSEQLHNKRLTARVSVEQGKDYVKDGQTVKGQPQNNVKKYTAYGSVSADAETNKPADSSPAGSATTPPWKK